jgi:hypothetical protein
MNAEESAVLNVNRLMRFQAGAEATPQTTPAEPESICDLVIEAVERTSREHALNVAVPMGADSREGVHLLRLLTYSYAKGVLSSREIERKCNAALGGFPIDAHLLRLFRRLNRPLLQTVLERTLRLIGKGTARARGSAPATSACVAAPPAPSTIMVTREATARLEAAVFIDGMSLD